MPRGKRGGQPQYRALATLLALIVGACGHHEGAGTIEGGRVPADVIEQRAIDRRDAAAVVASTAGTSAPDKQILFGDLHVHTTFSADAFMMSLPMMQGEGAHPLADACDFARYCSALDFWSINDHAESITPRRWRETKDTIRRCNAVADPSAPDVVAFLGWEWTQVGRTADDHYGHKNVIFRDIEDDRVPKRAIHSGSWAYWAMRQPPPIGQRLLLPIADWSNRQRYFNLAEFLNEMREVPECDAGVDTRELPEECSEGATTPRELFDKLAQWGFDSLVIPHGTTWGLYTPAGSTWDKQLTAEQHDPSRQTLIEVYSGHGNSEEYRPWRAVRHENGEARCPAPTGGFEPCCWRAGEIIRERCEAQGSEECERRVRKARSDYLAAGIAGRLSVPGAKLADWKNCDGCPDCFNPSMNYRPGGAVQYTLALSDFSGGGEPRRFHFGMIASSDNHRGRPGTGYKEYGRRYNSEAFGPRDATWYERALPQSTEAPAPESRSFDLRTSDLRPYQTTDFERQASFFMTGGLVGVHAEGRTRDEIWRALGAREVYGTSGERILLWFDLVGEGGARVPMGSRVRSGRNPRFRVRALGSLEQLPGCPSVSTSALSPERLERLCRGECYNPGDRRRAITRIEVVRIRPQAYPDEPVERLIDDPWITLDCPGDGGGCAVEFTDETFAKASRETVYYVRAIQEPTPAVNAGGLRCRDDPQGGCIEANPCYGDFRTPFEDDCLELNEERAWSSPIYVRPTSDAG